MPNTRMDKAKFKNHLHYAKWFYILGIIAVIFICDIAFTTTRYRSPDEKAVMIQLVDSYADGEPLNGIAASLLASGKEFDETLETVEFYALAYSGDAQNDYYGAQKFMVETMAGENDIFLVSKDILPSLILDSYCVPLETEEDLYAELLSRFSEEDLYWEHEIGEELGTDENGYTKYEVLETRHPYAIPCDTLNEFINLNSYDVTDKYMILSVTSKNVRTSYKTMLNLIDLTAKPLNTGTEENAE